MLLNLREYHRPRDLSEAAALLKRTERRTRVLAGGTELVGSRDTLTEAVVDLSLIGLAGVEAGAAELRIGAMTTLNTLAASPAIRQLAGGILARALEVSAPATIRAAATIGGTMASERSGADLPTVLLALGAWVKLANPDTLEVSLAEFLARRDALLNGAILTGVTISVNPGARGGLARVSRSPADRSIALACAVAENGLARVALGGVARYPRLLPQGVRPEQVAHVLEDWEVQADFRGSAEYRRWVAPVLVARALKEAGGQ